MKSSSEHKKRIQEAEKHAQKHSQPVVEKSTISVPVSSSQPKGGSRQGQPMDKKKQTRSEIKIRPATPGDAEFASKLLFLSSPLFAQNFIGLGKEERAKKIIKQMFTMPDHRLSYENVWIIELKGQKVGLISHIAGNKLGRANRRFGSGLMKFYKMNGKVALIKRILPLIFLKESSKKDYSISSIAVLPRFQGQGIGKIAIKHIEKQARATGFTSISVLVPIQNSHARAFFEHLGYKVRSVVLESNKRIKTFGSGYQYMNRSL